MSQENVEIMKAVMSRFEAGDRNEWRKHFDPDVVWDTSTSKMPAAGIYYGHEGVERFFRSGSELGAITGLRLSSTSMLAIRSCSCSGREG